VGAGDNEVIAASAGGDVDPANDFREKLAVEIGKKDPDRCGLARDEASRPAVRNVAERLGNIPDPESGFLCHRSSAIENA